jgi:hypothetical protein
MLYNFSVVPKAFKVGAGIPHHYNNDLQSIFYALNVHLKL